MDADESDDLGREAETSDTEITGEGGGRRKSRLKKKIGIRTGSWLFCLLLYRDYIVQATIKDLKDEGETNHLGAVVEHSGAISQFPTAAISELFGDSSSLVNFTFSVFLFHPLIPFKFQISLREYVAAQSTPRPRPAQPQQGVRSQPPADPAPNRQPAATTQAQPEEPPSPTSSTSSSKDQKEVAEALAPSPNPKPAMQAAGSVTLKATTTAATEPIRRWCTPTVGTVYKAVLDDGSTMVVKRLKDANPCERKEFEQYMDVIGKESGSG
ncbi:hypothetical protein ACFXTO_043218 [Malus domestica]